MSTVASFGDLLLLLVAGKSDSRKQQAYISRVDHFAPTEQTQQQMGRPYQSLAKLDGLKASPKLQKIERVMSVITLPLRLVTAPFRALVKIGQYDEKRTR